MALAERMKTDFIIIREEDETATSLNELKLKEPFTSDWSNEYLGIDSFASIVKKVIDSMSSLSFQIGATYLENFGRWRLVNLQDTPWSKVSSGEVIREEIVEKIYPEGEEAPPMTEEEFWSFDGEEFTPSGDRWGWDQLPTIPDLDDEEE